MSRWNALKKTYRMCTRLRAQRGGSRTGYLLDALWCSVRHGASPENYFVLRFFDLPDWQRAAFLTSGRSGALDRALNRNAAAAEKEALTSKARFLTVFAPDVRRAHRLRAGGGLCRLQRLSGRERHVLSQARERHDGPRYRALPQRRHP
ncbi:MAG: hypothetical protein ACLTR5_02345 [Oscillospiraceae bacterium]